MGKPKKKKPAEVNWRQTLIDFLASFLAGLALWLLDKLTR